jgi:hypothetical protein
VSETNKANEANEANEADENEVFDQIVEPYEAEMEAQSIQESIDAMTDHVGSDGHWYKHRVDVLPHFIEAGGIGMIACVRMAALMAEDDPEAEGRSWEGAYIHGMTETPWGSTPVGNTREGDYPYYIFLTDSDVACWGLRVTLAVGPVPAINILMDEAARRAGLTAENSLAERVEFVDGLTERIQAIEGILP